MAPARAQGRQKAQPGAAIPKETTAPSPTVSKVVTPATSKISSRTKSRLAEPTAELTSVKQKKRSAKTKTTSNGVLKDATPRTNRKLKRLDVTAVTKSPDQPRKGSLRTPTLLVKSTSKVAKINKNIKSLNAEETVVKKTKGNVSQGISKPSRKSNISSSVKSPGLGRNTPRVTTISSSTPLASSIGNISSFSDFSDTASPIIRTRKPNLKYADFALPSNSFLKKVLLKNSEPVIPVSTERNAQSTLSSSETGVHNKSSPVAVKNKSITKSPSKNVTLKTPGKSVVPSVKEQSSLSPKNKSLPKTSQRKLSLVVSSKAKSKKKETTNANQSKSIIQSKTDTSVSKIQGVRTRVNRKPNPKYSPPVSPARLSPQKSRKVGKNTKTKSASPKPKASTSRQRGPNFTKAVTIKDSGNVKKKSARSKNVNAEASTVNKASVSDTVSEKNRPANPKIPVLSSPVKLSQCSIQLAVFTSPPPGSSGKVSGPIPLGQPSNALLKPRLSKREQLALALRQGKLSDTVNASRVGNTTMALSAETEAANVIVKKPASVKKSDGKSANMSRKLSGALNISSGRSAGEAKKPPVWAKVSPIKNKSLTKRHLGELYNLSFTSEEDGTAKKPKKKSRRKIVKGKPKPVHTKSKLLTTDPEFNKAFPSMFGTQSFYSGSTSNQTVQVASNSESNNHVETRQRSPSPAVFDFDDHHHIDDVEMCDDHYDELPQENSTENFVPPPYETASSFVSNSTNVNVPAIVISAAGKRSIPAALATASAAAARGTQDGSSTVPSNQSASNNKNTLFNKEANNNSGNNASSKSIPTPAATRIMSKLVGGTSTPFIEQVRNPAFNVDHQQHPPLNLGHERTSSPPPPPATVSEQIQVCFGFDESEVEVDDNELSLNLSPVRRATNMGGLSHHHVSTMSSMLSDAGCGLKDMAPTRFVPVRAMGAPSFSSFSSSRTANNNTLGLLKSVGVQQANKEKTGKATSVSGSNRATQPPPPQTDAETVPESSPTNVASSSRAREKDALVTKQKGTSSKVSASKSPRTADDASPANDANAAILPPSSVNFDESQLFDEAPAESPAKNAVSPLPSHELNDQQAPSQPVATPEKSFNKPPRKSYDRRSLDESRRMLLESLAGGAPDSGDEEADQEDLSQVVTRRRKKKKPLTNSSERRLQQKSKVADPSSKRMAAKRSTTESAPNPDPDTSQEDGSTPPAPKRMKPILKPVKPGTKKAPARTKQTKLKVVKINPPRQAESGEGTMRKGGDASGDSTASSSGIFSLSSKTKKQSNKSVAFEQTVIDWASDVNSHFSEIEDCELVLA